MTHHLHALRAAALLLGVVLALPVQAQEDAPTPLTTAEALERLPDPDRFRLEVENAGLTPDAVQEIGSSIIETIGGDHYYGAVAGHVPEDSLQLVMRIRTKLHSLEAAERAALADCETERTGGSPCVLVGRIIPDDAGPDAPDLSHDPAYAVNNLPEGMDGPIFLARSRETPAWALWSGANVRQSALDECNERAAAAGGAADCDIVIADAP